mmetsp:Transcript_9030/g.26974  ORF Transcript_9030/g.26974 Transcript_9030/m.26974 type:complete len:229 (-) Transcript_9030:457-1143(-)
MSTFDPSEEANLAWVSMYLANIISCSALSVSSPPEETPLTACLPPPCLLPRDDDEMALAILLTASAIPSASNLMRSRSASASITIDSLLASASARTALALPSASFTSVRRSPSDLSIAALFFRSAAICNSIAARMSLEGSRFCISTRVIITPHPWHTAFISASNALLIRSRDENDSSSVNFPTASRSCVRQRFSIAMCRSSTLYLDASESMIRRKTTASALRGALSNV